jgi:hypothetical protein
MIPICEFRLSTDGSEEKWRAAIGAGGDELEFTGSITAEVEGHG